MIFCQMPWLLRRQRMTILTENGPAVAGDAVRMKRPEKITFRLEGEK